MQNFLPPRIPGSNQTEAQRSGFGLEKEEGTKGYGACTAGGMYLVSSGKVEIIQNFPPPGIPVQTKPKPSEAGSVWKRKKEPRDMEPAPQAECTWFLLTPRSIATKNRFSVPLFHGILRSAQNDSVKSSE